MSLPSRTPLQNMVSAEDKQVVESKVKETLDWLDRNTLADKAEYDDKIQELQKECSPIMTKLHSGTNGKTGHNRADGYSNRRAAAAGGPTIEEVD